MNKKRFRKWGKFHRLGKSKFIMFFSYACILIGNICEQIVNLICAHHIVLSLREILVPTVLWAITGICFGLISWNSNETAFNHYVENSTEEEKEK